MPKKYIFYKKKPKQSEKKENSLKTHIEYQIEVLKQKLRKESNPKKKERIKTEIKNLERLLK